MDNQRNPNYIWGVILIGAGLLFLMNQLIPGLGFVGDLLWAAAFAAGGIAVYSVYAKNKQRRGMLIPAYVLFAIAGVILLDMFPLPDDLIGAYVMFAIALPFFYVYFQNNKQWWALIPAGVMSVIGIGLLFSAAAMLVPVALILIGVYILVSQVAGKKKAAPSQPVTGPEADKPRG